MGKAGRRRVRSYSQEFKLRAVQLSQQPGVLVRDVAQSLCIHPFMLSRWRKEAREGRLRGRGKLTLREVRDVRRLSGLERAYALLREEHELLKKAIRFCSARRPRSSPSSRPRRTGSA